MNTEINNISDIKGNKNIALQNITANDIVIYSGNEIGSEIKNVKKEIAKKITDLIHLVSFRSENLEEKIDNIETDLDFFQNFNFEELIDAIECKTCVLFIGPYISLDETGESLHENFFKKISGQNRKYNEYEGFFMPDTEERIRNKAYLYYNGEFQSENKIANSILKKIAQIPFNLIVSFTPDDTIHKIYNDHNIKHEYLYYKPKEKYKDIDFDKNTPIIYNSLGSANADGIYIYTHKQFRDYIIADKSEKYPDDIELKIINKATYYLFLGFKFNEWQYKLLMYELNLKTAKGVESIALDANKTKTINQEFIKEQFNISFINEKCSKFTDMLLFKSKKKGLTKSLEKTFIDSIFDKLEKIRINTVDSSKLGDLENLKKELSDINIQINDKIDRS